jgi:hypothetical protein
MILSSGLIVWYGIFMQSQTEAHRRLFSYIESTLIADTIKQELYMENNCTEGMV